MSPMREESHWDMVIKVQLELELRKFRRSRTTALVTICVGVVLKLGGSWMLECTNSNRASAVIQSFWSDEPTVG